MMSRLRSRVMLDEDTNVFAEPLLAESDQEARAMINYIIIPAYSDIGYELN